MKNGERLPGGDKLRALLKEKGRGATTRLAEALRDQYGRRTPDRVVYRWQNGEGFTQANQRIVEQIFDLPRGFFEDAESSGGPAGREQALEYPSLTAFVDSLRDTVQAVTEEELFWLASQRFVPSLRDPGTGMFWFGLLSAYRSLMSERRATALQPPPVPPLRTKRKQPARRS